MTSLHKALALLVLALPVTATAEIRPGDRAADFQQRTLSGQTLRLSSLRGKVVLVDFWASWCEPCKRELPLLEKLAKRLPADVEIVAINIDDNPQNAQGFMRSHDLHQLKVVVDGDKSIVSKWEPPKMPTSFIVDKSGVVRALNAGFDAGDEAKLEAQLISYARK